MTVSDTVIELRDVFCVHRTQEGDAAALQGLSLEIGRGEQLCILGPSGAGKTTLLRVVAGLHVPSAGIVRVLGTDIGRLPARARAALRHEAIGVVGQRADLALVPDLSVGEAVALPLILRGSARATRRARIQELLDAAALGDRADALPHQLSGGERQRVALCAALAHRPGILLADEPTGELDDHAAEAVRHLLAETCRADGTTVLIVSHDPHTAARAQRTLRMRDGRIVGEGGDDDSDGAIVVGRGGWLQLPSRVLARAGITGRARVEQVDGGLVLRPADPHHPPLLARDLAQDLALDLARAPARQRGAAGCAWQPAEVELRSVSRHRGGGSSRRLVIDQLSQVLATGRMTAVTGRSGTGKTTLLGLIAGLDVPDDGELLVDRRPLGALNGEQLAQLRRQRVGYLPQEPSPVAFLSAQENVALALALRGWDAAEASERVAVVLARVGLEDRARQRVARLSAGEAQRAALARALASARGLLIVDEPTSRLDEPRAAAVAQLLVQAAAEDGQTVICATHDPEVIGVADEVLALGE